MTETMIALPGLIAKSGGTDFLRELIQDAAQRLMDIEVAARVRRGPRVLQLVISDAHDGLKAAVRKVLSAA